MKNFLDEPETQRLLIDAEVDGGNPEVGARALCINALKLFRRAHRAGDNEQAWRYLEHAKSTYKSLPEFRKGLKLALWEFFRGWFLMKGPSKRRLSEHPVFNEFARLGDMDADQILFEIKSMEQSRRGSKPRPRTAMTLQQRGFQCVLEVAPNISASELIDMVKAGSGAAAGIYDFEDDNLRLYLDSNDSLVIKDLDSFEKTSPIPTQPTDHIRNCLKRARDRNT